MSSIGNLASGATDLATYLQHQKQGPAEKLFAKMDTNGDGKIDKSELEAAFTAAGGSVAQADALFSKLDKDGDGSVTKAEFVTAASRGGHAHHARASSSGSSQGSGSKAASTDTPSTTEVQNADGSTTMTITAADGTKITFVMPAPTDDSGPKGGQNPSGSPKVSIVV